MECLVEQRPLIGPVDEDRVQRPVEIGAVGDAALTAATASMTLPGPSGSPAARSVRAKCIKLATRRPS
jgi:hypothetical protein